MEKIQLTLETHKTPNELQGFDQSFGVIVDANNQVFCLAPRASLELILECLMRRELLKRPFDRSTRKGESREVYSSPVRVEEKIADKNRFSIQANVPLIRSTKNARLACLAPSELPRLAGPGSRAS